MSRAFESAFVSLTVSVPCCGSTISLNDLHYERPAGFARFVLEARNPNVADLPEEEIAGLSSILGASLRLIWARY